MPFLKGQPKIAGRKKGSLNKTYNEKRLLFIEAIGFCEESIKEDIKSLSPAERLKFWMQMQQPLFSKYFPEPPKQQADGEPQKMEITRRIIYKAVTDAEIESGEWKNEE